MRTRSAVLPVVLCIMAISSCSDQKPDSNGSAISSAGMSPAPAVRGALPERSAAIPESPCGWLPVSEVEAVVGKLNGPPREERGGCFYPLPVDSITLARRAKAEELKQSLKRAGLDTDDLPPEPEDTAGVFISVQVGAGAEERAAELAFGTMGTWVGNDSLFAAAGPGESWDYRRRLPGKPNFMGRAGTVFIIIEGGTSGMDDDILAALAARVRDRIPDLPFVDPVAGNGLTQTDQDPCAMLTRAEAEAVLGELLVAPYRVWNYARAHPGGGSCAYTTRGHHTLIVKPHFVGGAEEMHYVRSRGGLGAVGIVDREAEGADTLEGPWEEAAIGMEGQLAVAKVQRMVEISYLTSSTDLAGAMRLAGAALDRLAATQ